MNCRIINLPEWVLVVLRLSLFILSLLAFGGKAFFFILSPLALRFKSVRPSFLSLSSWL